MKLLSEKYFFKVLDLSSAHIPHTTVNAIDAGTIPEELNVVPWRDSGWVFYVPEIIVLVTLRLQGHGALIDLLRLARENGCDFLRLDQDSNEYADLPTFDW